MGKTRDLFKEIKDMTESCISSCGAMKISSGRVVSEENDIKKMATIYRKSIQKRS